MNETTLWKFHSDFCSEVKWEIMPGVIFAWARQGEKRTHNVVIKGVEWNIPNNILKAYLSCFCDVSPEGVRWADMEESSWLSELNPDTGNYAKLASGERLARVTTSTDSSSSPSSAVMRVTLTGDTTGLEGSASLSL